jgi:hypothetical protein
MTDVNEIMRDPAIIAAFAEHGSSNAFMLYGVLLHEHAGADEFPISPRNWQRSGKIKAWSERRFREAIADLLLIGIVEVVHRGGSGRGDASTYRFATRH